MADEYSNRTAIDGVISNLKSIKEPNFISFEKTGSLEYSRVPMYTDKLSDKSERYRSCIRYHGSLLQEVPVQLRIHEYTSLLSTRETDELKKLLHGVGELALNDFTISLKRINGHHL